MKGSQKVYRIDVIKTKVLNPCATLQQIGDKYGITKERIRQIIKPLKLPTGQHARSSHDYICPQCGSKKSYGSKLCRKCASPQYIPLACEVCGKVVYRNKKHYLYNITKGNYQHQYYSKQCQGRYTAETYGFKKGHTNYGARPLGSSKYHSQIPEIIMRLNGNESFHSILVKLSIPTGNYNTIKKMVNAYQDSDIEL